MLSNATCCCGNMCRPAVQKKGKDCISVCGHRTLMRGWLYSKSGSHWPGPHSCGHVTGRLMCISLCWKLMCRTGSQTLDTRSFCERYWCLKGCCVPPSKANFTGHLGFWEWNLSNFKPDKSLDLPSARQSQVGNLLYCQGTVGYIFFSWRQLVWKQNVADVQDTMLINLEGWGTLRIHGTSAHEFYLGS